MYRTSLIQDVNAGDLYPATRRAPTDVMANASSMFGARGTTAAGPTQIAPDQNSDDEIAQAAAVGARVNPLIAIAIGIALVFAFVWGSHRLLGGGNRAGAIELSTHNVLTIGFVAMFFLALAKIGFTKIKVPGLTTVAYLA
jgi:hypothetical protein